MEIKHQNDILALIARNLAGLADSVEIAQLNDWIAYSEENNQYFKQLKNLWDVSDKQTYSNKINTQEALDNVLSRIVKVSPKKAFWYYWQKVAAVMILPLAIGTILWFYLNSQKANSLNNIVYNEVHAAFGTRSSLILADSSIVWLNSGSNLRYPIKFNNRDRHVYLKGEAYFEVKSDVSRPFIVQTSNLKVSATGTKFNIRDYDSVSIVEATLVSGKIRVEGNVGSNSQLISCMNPGQHLEYNWHIREKTITEEDTYKYIAWKDGKLIFRNEPLSEVVNKISLIFNVDIELQGKELQDFRYHATFQEESLEEILKLLKLSSPINYKEIERNPLPDGSFSKKKVIIFPANKL